MLLPSNALRCQAFVMSTTSGSASDRDASSNASRRRANFAWLLHVPRLRLRSTSRSKRPYERQLSPSVFFPAKSGDGGKMRPHLPLLLFSGCALVALGGEPGDSAARCGCPSRSQDESEVAQWLECLGVAADRLGVSLRRQILLRISCFPSTGN